jgi:DNA-directed RNA polymerase subunit M/transcription elongation factor TFIIS
MSFLSGLVENFELQNFEQSKKKKIDSIEDRSVSDTGRSPNDRTPNAEHPPPERAENTKVLVKSQEFLCSKCGSGDGWELLIPGGGPSLWRCLHCEPPAARWMVKRVVRVVDLLVQSASELESIAAQTLEARKLSIVERWVSEGVWPQSRVVVALGKSVCEKCGSAVVIEYSDRMGEVVYRCYTCKGHVDAGVVFSVRIWTVMNF